MKNFVSFNEEIYTSIQKLVHYLPQMRALQKFKNCSNQNIGVYITKATNKLEKNKWDFLAVRFIIHKNL